ncbi:ferritin-like domain-containing protein [Pikeienuella piscinae]|uniref:Ferritin-like domain-containing protein n=1 Tax=Pikeienuella piscinae TaxID=2748098 RepID=A0A7M3T714_9RHOB|nr:ferritin-like domain-containing protein [Pikeienuella piscinae]
MTQLALGVLTESDAREKARKARAAAALWRDARARGEARIGDTPPPDAPARPATPLLLPPRDMPKRRRGGAAGRAALLHAIAHIELNAIDLHWDMAARFADRDLPTGFFDDWVAAGDDEAKHFGLVADRLEAMGTHYGALPAHAGMWRAAKDTRADIMARLAVVPMVLEARGLDVTPGMIAAFEAAGDEKSVAALRVIYAEEVAHVAYGAKWFNFLCGRRDDDPKPAFHALVRKYFPAGPKPPFNEEKRGEAGLPPDFYWPLVNDAG